MIAAAVELPSCSLNPFNAAPVRPTARADAPANASASATTTAFAACPQHFPRHVPAVAWPGRQRALCFDSFATLYSGESKTPVYSVERLTAARMVAAKTVPRIDHFYPEARLPSADRAQLADYLRSGYDRGHMAPAGDMPTPDAKAQSFSLANMVPQAPKLNERDWSQIEGATRQYAARAPGDVFVFTGPAFSKQPQTIGAGRVWVPSYTWKVVYSSGDSRAWAYWMDNTNDRHSLQPISYQEFVRRSGLALLADPAM